MTKGIAMAVLVSLAVGGAAGYFIGYDIGYDKAVEEQQPVTEYTTPDTQTPPTNDQPDSGTAQRPPVNSGANDIASVPFRYLENYGFYGTLTLTGYLQVETRICAPSDPCEETVDLASFVFSESSSDQIYALAEQWQGNSFISNNSVGIGCYQQSKHQIYYQNFGDQSNVTGTISGTDFTKLAASSAANQVQLRLTKPIYTSGRGAPDCYSHFRNFDVL